MEFYMPNGKSIQGPDFHHDGQIFAKAYNIKFLNKEGKEEYAYQNTFAITTRMLGVMFAVHSDSKGLILPPKIAPTQVVIVPILFEDSKNAVLKKAHEIKSVLHSLSVKVDDRQEYNPGFKFNEWELKGIPIRIEIGPKDLQKDSVVLVRRDTQEKEIVKTNNILKRVTELLDTIQKNLFQKASKLLHNNIVRANTLAELNNAIKNKKIVLAPLCSSAEIEDTLKAETQGAKVLNIPFGQPRDIAKAKCVISGKKADYFAYVAKSY